MSQRVTRPGITTGKGMGHPPPRPGVTNGRENGYDYDPPSEGKITSPLLKRRFDDMSDAEILAYIKRFSGMMAPYIEEPTPRREVQMGYEYEPPKRLAGVPNVLEGYTPDYPKGFKRPDDWPAVVDAELEGYEKGMLPKRKWWQRKPKPNTTDRQ